MNYKALIVITSALFLTSCGLTPEDVIRNQAVTQRSLENPEIIGKTFDGQVVRRSIIVDQCEACESASRHFVYMVGNVTTDNYKIRNGKLLYDKVDVTIKLPENPTEDDILARAKEIQERKQSQKQNDEKEFQRLCKELNKPSCDPN